MGNMIILQYNSLSLSLYLCIYIIYTYSTQIIHWNWACPILRQSSHAPRHFASAEVWPDDPDRLARVQVAQSASLCHRTVQERSVDCPYIDVLEFARETLILGVGHSPFHFVLFIETFCWESQCGAHFQAVQPLSAQA